MMTRDDSRSSISRVFIFWDGSFHGFVDLESIWKESQFKGIESLAHLVRRERSSCKIDPGRTRLHLKREILLSTRVYGSHSVASTLIITLLIDSTG